MLLMKKQNFLEFINILKKFKVSNLKLELKKNIKKLININKRKDFEYVIYIILFIFHIDNYYRNKF